MYNSQSYNCVFTEGDEDHGYIGQRADQVCVIWGRLHQRDCYPMGECECYYYNGTYKKILFDMHGNFNSVREVQPNYGIKELYRFVSESDPNKEVTVEFQPAESSSTVTGQENS